MRQTAIIIVAAALSTVLPLPRLQAQNPPSSLSVYAPAPPPVSGAGASYSGPAGSTTIYYWVIARYPAGLAVPQGPVPALNTQGSDTLSATVTVTISWPAVAGATSYDVLRSATTTYPAPCAACAVALANTSGTVTDNGSALSAYPPAGVGGVGSATGVITIDNVSATYPFWTLNLAGTYRWPMLSGAFTAGNVPVFDSRGNLVDSGGTPSAGSVTASGTLTSGLPIFGAGAAVVTAGTKRGNTTQAQMTTGSVSTNDCAKFDSNGNIISTGAACASVSADTVTAAGTLTADAPMIGAGTKAAAVGTKSGNTTAFVTTTGTQTASDCVSIDASGNHVASGAPCASALPTQTSHGGEILTTSGSAASWARFPGSPRIYYGTTDPATVSFTNINTAVLSQSAGVAYVSSAAAGGEQLRSVVVATPGVPYTLKVTMILQIHQLANQTVGLTWRQSSDGKQANCVAATGNGTTVFASNKFTNATTFSADYVSISMLLPVSVPITFFLQDDGASRICGWYPDGVNQEIIHSVGRTDFLTADQIGVAVDANNATWAAGGIVTQWALSTP